MHPKQNLKTHSTGHNNNRLKSIQQCKTFKSTKPKKSKIQSLWSTLKKCGNLREHENESFITKILKLLQSASQIAEA